MDKDKIFESFAIRDYVEICKGMRYWEFVTYSQELLCKLDGLNLSKNGFYNDKVGVIQRLKDFIKYAQYHVSTDGGYPAGASQSDFAYCAQILQALYKNQSRG